MRVKEMSEKDSRRVKDKEKERETWRKDTHGHMRTHKHAKKQDKSEWALFIFISV